MARSYVQHMCKSMYPIAKLTPYLTKITNGNAQISFYVVSELLSVIHN